MKRLFTYFLAVVIGWVSVTQPARAFVPPLALAAYLTTSTGAGTYAISALAGVIGMTGMYLTLKDSFDNEVRVPVGPNPANQPPVPSVPASVDPQPLYTNSACKPLSGPTPQSVCVSQTCDSTYYGDPVTNSYELTWTGSACNYTFIQTRPNGAETQRESGILSTSYSLACPAGYVSSSVGCALVNARQSADDKRCDILLINGQFATADDLNCRSTADGSKIAPMIRDGKVIAYGTNSSGQPIMWEVSPGANSYTVTQSEQIQTATQTQVKQTVATIDAATSAVTSVQTQTSPGSIASPSAATVPTVTSPADPTTATNTPTVTRDETKPADVQTCGLPGAPACNIDDSQFDGKDNFSTPRNSEINDKLDQNKTQLENSKDSLPTIGTDWLPSLMPGNATACAPLIFDFTLNNRIAGTLAAPNIQLDICDKLDLVRAILGYMLGVWTVWYVWRRFTTANQGA